MRPVPSRDAGELEWVTFEQSGVLTTAQAVAVAGRGAVRGHLVAGRWRRLCRGILSTHNGPLCRPQQLWAAVLAGGRGAVLSGAAALAESGVRGVRLEPIDVLIPAGRNRTSVLPTMPPDMPGVVLHRTRVLPTNHLQVGRPPRTTTARAVIDAAMWAAGADQACAVLAAACQQGRTTPGEISAVLTALRRVPRRELLRATLLDIAGGAQSLPEIDFGALCRRFALPPPDRQQRRRDAAGRIRYLDAYWSRWRLHAEVDGSHHRDDKQWTDDMIRQNDMWISGDRILRFPARMIRLHPIKVATQLHAALEAAGWSP